MELYILSKEDLRILSICKVSDYQINLDEETNAKSTFTLIKTEGLVKDNFIVVNGLYKQFLFIIDDVQTEKGSNAVTVTALDISNIFDRKVIEKNTNTMRDKSIEEFIAKTISENFVNSDDTILNNDHIEVNWHTDTQGMVDTNTENGIYNFHTFLINCRQYKNIYTNFNVENIGKLQEIEGKHIKVNAKKRKGTISLHGETNQATRSGKNLLNVTATSKTQNGITFTINADKSITINGTNTGTGTLFFRIGADFTVPAGNYTLCNKNATVTDNMFIFYDDGNSFTRKNISNATLETETIIKPYIKVVSGATINNQTVYPMIVQGTYTEDTIGDYEPYGASPSPGFPSEIENVEGKNLYEIKGTTNRGVEGSLLSSGYLKVNGTPTGSYSDCTLANTRNLLAGNYSISITSPQTFNVALRVTYEDNTNDTFTVNIGQTSKTITTTKNIVSYRVLISGLTTGTAINSSFGFMLEKNTVATEYVPYNSLAVKVTGKNILPIRWGKGYTTTTNGITYKVNDDYSITINGTATANAFFNLNNIDGYYLNVVENKAYTLSLGASDSKLSFNLRKASVSESIIVMTGAKTKKGISNYTGKAFGFLRVSSGATINNLTVYPMIVEGEYTSETIGEYEQCKEQTVYFPLAEGQKLMEGSYLADNGVHNVRRQVVLDGSDDENWNIQYSGTENFIYRYRYLDDYKYAQKQNNFISNLFSSGAVGSTNTVEGIYITNANELRIRFGEEMTLDNWRAWLQVNPITVEYELAEEETVPYTVEQKEAWEKLNNLILFDGINNINSTANISLNYYPQNPTGVKLILNIDIQKKEEPEVLIDTMLPEITDYNKIYEEDVTAKVTVLIRESGEEYNLYLKTDRTTTTDKNEANRAKGKIEVISVETADLAAEEALNVMKGNNYKHLVEFKIAKTSKLMDITKLHIGRPIRIRTEDDIYDSYISAITLSDENFVYFKSGSLRTTLLDKLKKNKDNVGNKLDVSGGNIKGNLNIEGNYQIVGNSVFNGKINNNNIKSVDIDANFKTAFKTQTKGDTNALGGYISTIRNNTANVEGAPQHGSGLAWGRADTHGYLYVGYSKYSDAFIGGGNENELEWIREISTSTVLYDNTTGSSGTITLNDTADSYKYIEIYAQGFNSPVYTKVRAAGMAKLSEINFSADYTAFQWFFCQYYISGTTLAPQRYYYMSHYTNGNVYSENYNYFQITKVVGYR